MKLIKTMMIVFGLVIGLTACGDNVEVPPVHVGKIITKNGYQPEVIPPSKFRLPACLVYCDKLVLLEAGDEGGAESFEIVIPQDELTASLNIRFTMSINSTPENIEKIFNRVTPQHTNEDGVSVVTIEQIYNTYGKQVVREVTQTTLSRFSISELIGSRERVNAELFNDMSAALKNTPIRMQRIAISNFKYPELIKNAKESAAKRREEYAQQEATNRIKILSLQAELEQEKARRAIRRERAEAAKEENEIYSESVTDKYLKYRQLEVLEEMAKNKNAVFIPLDALQSLGLQNRMFAK